MKNAGKACNNRLYRHIRTFEKIIKNYFVIYLKINHIKDYVEKIAIYFGTNMTLLFTSSIFLFFGKIVEDGILVFE